MDKVIVTGGKGFIGSRLVERLRKKGIEADSFDLKDGQDIRKADLKFDSYDAVFHLAALRGVQDSYADPRGYFDTNVWGTFNMLSKFNGVRIVNTSSSSAIKMLSPYAMTKACAEKVAEIYSNVVTLRPFNVFGPEQMTDAVIPSFIRNCINKKHSTIYGDGCQSRDFTYRDDVVDEMIWHASRKSSGVHDMGYKEERSVNDIYKMVSSYFGYKGKPIHEAELEGDQRRSRSTELFHIESVGFDEGLKRTMKWFEVNYHEDCRNTN